MTDALTSRFRSILRRAQEPGNTEETSTVLEALALVLPLEAGARLDAIEDSDRARLRTLGRAALLRAGGEGDERIWARDLARAGLDRLLGGELAEGIGDPMHPPAGRLLDMLRGEPDGFSAGACAAHVLGCDVCAGKVAVLRQQSRAPATRLRVAAAGSKPMRPPHAGRSIASLSDPEVEAVLFEQDSPRRLAVYSTLGVPLRLEADGVVTEHMLSGYWIGHVPENASELEGVLHFDDRAISWSLPLDATQS